MVLPVRDGASFDPSAVFDEDYLTIYGERFDDAASDREAGLAWQLLALSPGDKVLDIGCGHGRIANRLANMGASVTGLDVTPLFLEVAKRDAELLGVDVEYVARDMRELPWQERFDAAIFWGTALGYFDDGGNRAVLAAAREALRVGGSLLVDVYNGPHQLRAFQPSLVMRRQHLLVVDESDFDPETNRISTRRTIVDGSRVRTFSFFSRTFSFPELRDWLLDVGLSNIEAFTWNGTQPLTMDSWRMIVRANRSR